jgi:hypothetical protein
VFKFTGFGLWGGTHGYFLIGFIELADGLEGTKYFDCLSFA